jgi:hypothetical protein
MHRNLLNSMCGLVIAAAVLLSGCANMPTPPEQITGSNMSRLEYDHYDCSQLTLELSALERLENQLVIAQEQRIESSKVQARWLCYGQGDGIEASELADVRGEKKAVRQAIENRNCGLAYTATMR